MAFTKTYLEALKGFRFLVLSLVGLGFLYLLAAFGFALLLLGLSGLLPAEPLAASLSFLGLGAAILLLGAWFFSWLFSERRWMEQTGALSLMEKTLAESKRDWPPSDLSTERRGRRKEDQKASERFFDRQRAA